jgi:RHS repeat-associated protein
LPIDFSYTSGPTTLPSPSRVEVPHPDSWIHAPIIGDFDGDGRSDLAFFLRREPPDGDPFGALVVRYSSTLPGGPPSFGPEQLVRVLPIDTLQPRNAFFDLRALDLDRDGLTDLLVTNYLDDDRARWRWFRSLGRPPLGQLHFSESYLPGRPANGVFADFTGDGLVDFAGCDDDGKRQFRFATAPGVFGPPVVHDFSCRQDMAMDSDGDGVSELFTHADGYRSVAYPNGVLEAWWQRATPEELHNPDQFGYFVDATLADLNGDGLQDLAYHRFKGRVSDHTDVDRLVLISTGNGLPTIIAAHQQLRMLRTDRFSRNAPVLGAMRVPSLADLNGDGKADFVTAYHQRDASGELAGGGVLVDRSRDVAGSNRARVFFAREDVPYPGVPHHLLHHLQNANFFGDFDGNGLPDLLKFNESCHPESGRETHPACAGVYLQTGNAPDLLESVKEGSEEDAVRIAYGTIADPRVYSATSDCVSSYPLICLRGGTTQVVIAVSQDAGLEDTSVRRLQTYHYQNSRIDLRGRGWLGFERVKIAEPAASATEEFTYDNFTRVGERYPFLGLLKRRERVVTLSDRSGPTKSVSVFAEDYSTVAPHPGTYLTYATRLETATYLLSHWPCGLTDCRPLRRTVSTVTRIDPLGFATEVVEDFGDGVSRTITRTFENDTQGWIIGQVASERIQSSVPTLGSKEQVRSWFYDGRSYRATTMREGAINNPRHEIQWRHDDFGNVYSERQFERTRNLVRTSTIEYDDQKLLPIGVRDTLGRRTALNFHPIFGGPRKVVDPNHEVIDLVADRFGRAVRLVGRDGLEQRRVYGPITSGNLAFFRIEDTAPDRPPIVREFDRLGREVRVAWIGFDGNEVQVATLYDALGRRIGVTEPFAIGQQPTAATEWTFDELHRLRVLSLPSGVTWEWKYGVGLGASRMTQTTLGESVRIFDPSGRAQDRFFDGRGLLERARDAAGGVTTYTYGPFSALATMTDPAGNGTIFSFDAYGLREWVQEPTIGLTRFTSDGFGQLRTITNAAGQVTELDYDALGRMITRRDDVDGTITFRYDVSEQCARQPDPERCAAAAHSLGRLVTATSRDGHAIQHSYDAAGRLTGQRYSVDGASYGYEYRYDSAGRIATLKYPDIPDGRPFEIAYGYVNGFLESISNPANSHVLWQRTATDLRGFSTHEYLGNGTTIERSYALDGPLATTRSLTAAQSLIHSMGFDYDNKGNMIGRRDLLQGMTEHFGYDDLDRLSGACFEEGTSPVQAALQPPPPGTAAEMPIATPVWPGRLSALIPVAGRGARLTPIPNQEVEARRRADFAPAPMRPAEEAVMREAGELTIDTRGNPFGTDPFGADPVHHPCTTYSYDRLGNFQSRSDLGTYVYPALADGRVIANAPREIRLTTGGSEAITYDAVGRITAFGPSSYRYNAAGELVFAKPSQLVEGVFFSYDAFGNRAKKWSSALETIYAGRLFELRRDLRLTDPRVFALDAVSASYFIKAGDRVVAEVRYQAAPSRPALEGGTPAMAREAIRFELSHNIYYFHPDALGSVEAVSDGTGQFVERRSYGAFGHPRATNWRTGRSPAAAAYRPVGFTGHEDDGTLGLVNMVGRVYETRLSRFLTPDPFVPDPSFSQSLNRYAYVWNRPLTLTDPSGFSSDGSSLPGAVEEETLIVIQPPEAAGEEYGSSPVGWSGGIDLQVPPVLQGPSVIPELQDAHDLLLGARDGLVPAPAVGPSNGRYGWYHLGVGLGAGVGLVMDLALTMASDAAIGASLAASPVCATGVGCAAPAALGAAGVMGQTAAIAGTGYHTGRMNQAVQGLKDAHNQNHLSSSDKAASWTVVKDTAHMSDAARAFQRTEKSVKVPWKNKPSPTMRDVVAFDDWDEVSRQLVDRKLNVTRFPKSIRQAQRQAEVARQHGVGVRWEVPANRVNAAKDVVEQAGATDVIQVIGE